MKTLRNFILNLLLLMIFIPFSYIVTVIPITVQDKLKAGPVRYAKQMGENEPAITIAVLIGDLLAFLTWAALFIFGCRLFFSLILS